MLVDEENDFDALMAWRGLPSDAERLEQLFLAIRQNNREQRGTNTRLDYLNSTTKETKTRLNEHIDQHEQTQASIDYVKRWGARGTAAILLALAMVGGLSSVTVFIRYLQGGG